MSTLRASYASGFARNATEALYSQLRPGLIAAYHPPLGPTGLNLHDATGRSAKGILTTMDPATDWILDPEMGYVLDFDGDVSDGGVFAAGFPFLLNFTLSAWVNADVVDDAYIGIVCRGGTFDDNTNYAMSYRFRADGSTYRLTLYYRNGVNLHGAEFQLPGNISPVGVWHHIAASYDGTTIRAYQDGVQLAVASGDDTPSAIPADGSQSLSIGRPATVDSSDDPLDGRIAGVGIWDQALVGSQVKILANRPDALVARRTERVRQSIRGSVAPPAGNRRRRFFIGAA